MCKMYLHSVFELVVYFLLSCCLKLVQESKKACSVVYLFFASVILLMYKVCQVCLMNAEAADQCCVMLWSGTAMQINHAV